MTVNSYGSFPLPGGIDWMHWVERWDRMQERCLARRAERIELLVNLVRDTVQPVKRVLDLGCGKGSLMRPLLDAFPDTEVQGIETVMRFTARFADCPVSATTD